MRFILTIFTVLLVIPASAGAAERWRAPQTVAAAPSGVLWGDTDVAIDDRGGLVAVWSSHARNRHAVLASRASGGGRLGRPVSVRSQRGLMGEARVAFDEDRNAVVAYRRAAGGTHRVASRTFTARGRLRGEQLLSGGGPNAFEPLFARTAGETPILSWRRTPARADDLTVQLAAAQADGRFERSVTYRFQDAPQAWVVAGGPRDERYVATIRRLPESAFSQVVVGLPRPNSPALDLQAISSGERTVREVAMTVTRAGRVVVAWTENHSGRQSLWVSDRPADGTFEPPRQLLPADRYLDGLTLVSSGRDTARAAWVTAATRREGRLVRPALVTAKLGVGGDDGPQRDLSPAGQSVEAFTMGADGRGGVTALWAGDVAAEPGGTLDVRAITPQGRFGRVQRITARGERAVAAALGVGKDGDAAAVWTVAGEKRVRVARRPG